MAVAQGMVQFLGSIAELARGVVVPLVWSVWGHPLLEAHDTGASGRACCRGPGAVGGLGGAMGQREAAGGGG